MDINFGAIGEQALEFPSGKVFELSYRLQGETRTFVYKASSHNSLFNAFHHVEIIVKAPDGSQSILTLGTFKTDGSPTLTASVAFSDEKRDLNVESCGGNGCHVLIEESQEQRDPALDSIGLNADPLPGVPKYGERKK